MISQRPLQFTDISTKPEGETVRGRRKESCTDSLVYWAASQWNVKVKKLKPVWKQWSIPVLCKT